jgi:inosine-uridine nucleoside N-ribohydrolase
VSTVFGNTGAATAARCARALLRRCGVQVPVLAGAERKGEEVAAVVAALAALPAGTRLVALGPLTNVAAALRHEPGLARRITLLMVGGELASRGVLPPYWPYEFNLAKDPAATQVVFGAQGERRLFPLPVVRRLQVGPLRLARLARASRFGAYLAGHSLRWLLRAPLRYQALRFPLWDLPPALFAAGLLPVAFAEMRLMPYGRGGLRRDAAALPTLCATGFDAGLAWEQMVELVG